MGQVIKMGSTLAPQAVALCNSSFAVALAASEEVFRLGKKFAPCEEIFMLGWCTLEHDERGEFKARAGCSAYLALGDGRVIVHDEPALQNLLETLKRVLAAERDGGSDASSPSKTECTD